MRQRKPQAQKRRVEYCQIPREDLLKLLKAEAIAPEAATRIVSMGHTQEALVIGVTFDE